MCVCVVWLWLALSSTLWVIVNGVSCNDFDQSACERSRLCYWYTDSSQCRCNSTRDNEVVFVMDSSGSVGSSGWDDEELFVIKMVETGVNEDSVIGVVQFASSSDKKWYFTYSQDRTDITNMVDGLYWTKGATAIS